MRHADGTANWLKNGTRDGRWRYDAEVMTKILELAESCFEDSKFAENVGLDDVEGNEISDDAMESSANGLEDDVIQVENPNSIIPNPAIEVFSGIEIEPEIDYDAISVNQPNGEVMNEHSDPEEDIEEPVVRDPSPSRVGRGGWLEEYL